MNTVLKNRKSLEESNYVLKADSTSSYWFGLSKNKIDGYAKKFSNQFNIIIFGNNKIEGDYYVIPYDSIKDLLVPQALYRNDSRERWVADIVADYVRFRNTNIERDISSYYSLPIPESEKKAVMISEDEKSDYSIENAKRLISVRINQSKFRSIVLKNFKSECCISGVKEPDLLVASHIIPWADNISARLDPANGLCLLTLYDRLFDKGYFTLTDNLKVTIASTAHLSEYIKKVLNQINGMEISLPTKYDVSSIALKYHRDNIFRK